MRKCLLVLFIFIVFSRTMANAIGNKDTVFSLQENTVVFSEEELPLPEKNAQRISNLEMNFGKAGNLKISGYLQAQWQLAQQKGIDGFADGGSFNANTNNRFSVRRGRIKFTYTLGIVQMVVQPDFTEKGVSMKDAYVSVSAPNKVVSFQMGLFDRPFGYEISYSSSLRESPERSRVYLSLFPGERDLGAMLVLRGPSGFLNDLTLSAGIFNGNGIGVETDSRKDFIGRIAYLKKMNDAQVGLAFSYYNGGVLNAKDTNYTYDNGFQAQQIDKGSYSKRQYFGVAAQYIQQWAAGTTNIRTEYLWGNQPGISSKNAMPGGNSFANLNPSDPLFLRNFNGFYAILVQDIGLTKHSVVLKYDYYDPNTKIKGNQIGELSKTGAADIAYSTFGIGYLYRWNQNLRLMAYYDFVGNEKSDNLSSSNSLKNFATTIKQNVLTLRVQVKF